MGTSADDFMGAIRAGHFPEMLIKDADYEWGAKHIARLFAVYVNFLSQAGELGLARTALAIIDRHLETGDAEVQEAIRKEFFEGVVFKGNSRTFLNEFSPAFRQAFIDRKNELRNR